MQDLKLTLWMISNNAPLIYIKKVFHKDQYWVSCY